MRYQHLDFLVTVSTATKRQRENIEHEKGGRGKEEHKNKEHENKEHEKGGRGKEEHGKGSWVRRRQGEGSDLLRVDSEKWS